ncbi:LysR family transcriptional regulator [Rugosimonospora africana]|uniref:Putative HTH-type transcriptional regulator n=1 Tax=Rugosimonospora africana TaxID=556532 RepID=A0A8J3VRN2_9ACTN|nr:LysR family transcriptional regulator [Rugosimonospora africana]GIH16405.1 putative HTH-type transcriptional regulator [Rugosimonospora africana]
MTLTQLGAFVLVARLGSVRAAADVLGVSEPAVSRALAALRQHLGDQLLVRDGNGMALTEGGNRLFGIASQMVALGSDAEAAVRAAKGAPARLRLLVSSTIAEFIATPLLEGFGRRSGGAFDASSGVASVGEMRVLLPNRLADVALGPDLRGDADSGLISEPVLKYRIILVAGQNFRAAGSPGRWPWLVDSSGTDPDSDTGRLLRGFRVPESSIRVFPNQTAAWAAAADGLGVAPAVATLVSRQVRRGELKVVDTELTPAVACWYVTTLRPERRTAAARYLRNFLSTPDAMQLMCSPGTGVSPSRFRPPVYVTIWS